MFYAYILFSAGKMREMLLSRAVAIEECSVDAVASALTRLEQQVSMAPPAELAAELAGLQLRNDVASTTASAAANIAEKDSKGKQKLGRDVSTYKELQSIVAQRWQACQSNACINLAELLGERLLALKSTL
jgi:hypothetical protein